MNLAHGRTAILGATRRASRLPGRRSPRAPRRSAFTLLELLVVVAIIALLIALAVPSFTAARRQARRVQCQAQIKQITLAWNGWLVENKGLFRRSVFMDVMYGGAQVQDDSGAGMYVGERPLNKHLGIPALASTSAAGVFACPSDRGDAGALPIYGPVDERRYFDRFGTSYLANPLLVSELPIRYSSLDVIQSVSKRLDSMLAGLTTSQISNESRLVLVGDGPWQRQWSSAHPNDAQYWHTQPRMHNMGFMDGHTDYIEIRRGVHVSAKYTVIPFASMQSEVAALQWRPR